MDTTFAPITSPSGSPLWRRWLAVEIMAVIVAVALVLSLVLDSTSSTSVEVGNPGLSGQQIVIRGEVADRYELAGSGLSPEQIVIRGEVGDRYRDLERRRAEPRADRHSRRGR